MSAGEKKAQCRGRQLAAMGKVNLDKRNSGTDMTAAQGFTAGFDCAFYKNLGLTTGRWAGKVKFPNLRVFLIG